MCPADAAARCSSPWFAVYPLSGAMGITCAPKVGLRERRRRQHAGGLLLVVERVRQHRRVGRASLRRTARRSRACGAIRRWRTGSRERSRGRSARVAAGRRSRPTCRARRRARRIPPRAPGAGPAALDQQRQPVARPREAALAQQACLVDVDDDDLRIAGARLRREQPRVVGDGLQLAEERQRSLTPSLHEQEQRDDREAGQPARRSVPSRCRRPGVPGFPPDSGTLRGIKPCLRRQGAKCALRYNNP